MTNERVAARFWFDPLCPWAWLTSRWMHEVTQVRDVDVSWHIMSLQVLNEPRAAELPPQYAEMFTSGKAWEPVRLVAAARAAHGDEIVDPLYTALGTRFHNRGLPKERDTYLGALSEVGLPAELAAAVTSTEFDDDIRASHQEGIGLVGEDVGTPVIAVPGPKDEPIAFFGPVVTPAPKGEAAGRLWDGTLLVAEIPGFYELKRTRVQGPTFD